MLVFSEAVKIVKVKVLFLGSLEKVTGVKEIEIEGIDNLFDLLRHLRELFPLIGPKSRISVNRETVPGNIQLVEGDEVVLFPPFAVV